MSDINLKKEKIFFKILDIKQRLKELNFYLSIEKSEDIENIDILKKYFKDSGISYPVLAYIVNKFIQNIETIEIQEYNKKGKLIIDKYLSIKEVENKIKKLNKNKISQSEKIILKKTNKLEKNNHFFGDI